MKFSPSNFYIGIVDLFSILLPGAIASLALYYFFQSEIDAFLSLGGKENAEFFRAFILLFSSYLFGHIISQLSAYLDSLLYDRLKKFVYRDSRCLDEVWKIRREKFGNHGEPVLVNAYKWSLFKLQTEHPAAASEVERYMADSKFFRSLIIIMLVMGIVLLWHKDMNMAVPLSCFALAIFSTIRYFKKRRKSTETAYQCVIYLERLSEPLS